MGRAKTWEYNFKNVCFTLEVKQVETLWRMVEKNGFTSLSEMMRDIVRDYINRTINLKQSMENYCKDFRRIGGIDHKRFKKMCSEELKSARM